MASRCWTSSSDLALAIASYRGGGGGGGRCCDDKDNATQHTLIRATSSGDGPVGGAGAGAATAAVGSPGVNLWEAIRSLTITTHTHTVSRLGLPLQRAEFLLSLLPSECGSGLLSLLHAAQLHHQPHTFHDTCTFWRILRKSSTLSCGRTKMA